MANTTEPKTSIETIQKRIIKKGSCPTLSGKESLTYHIGCYESNAIYFRVVANSGNGFFNKDWPVDSSITSFTLWSLLE